MAQLPTIIMTDSARGQEPRSLLRALGPGSVVIFRHYDISDRSVLALDLSRLARSRQITVIIAGDPALARACGTIACHLPSWILRNRKPIRYRAGRGMLVFAAVHDRIEAGLALRLGVDAVIISPVFPTKSHPGAQPLGPIKAGRLAAEMPVPVFALGGISRQTKRRLPSRRFWGIVGVSLQGL